jgi:hypothetical protein
LGEKKKKPQTQTHLIENSIISHFDDIDSKSVIFLMVNFRHLMTKRKSSVTNTKDFCEKFVTKSSDF